MILFTWLALHSFSPAGPCTTPCNGLDPGLRITTLHSAGAGRFKSHGVNQLLCYASDLRTSGLSLTCCLSPITQRLILSSAGVQVPVEDAGLPQGSTKTLPVPMGPVDSSLPQLPVLETGEAGPPGRMIPSKLPKGTDGSMKPVQGFAGAPGESPTRTWSLLFPIIVSRVSSSCFTSQRPPTASLLTHQSPARPSPQVNTPVALFYCVTAESVNRGSN